MKPTVICNDHGFVELGDDDYQAQLLAANDQWKCPVCGEGAAFDDDSIEPQGGDYEAPAF